MPRVSIDYNNVMIYKLVCRDTNITELYVGHTTDWRTRKNLHKSCCCNENSKGYNQKKYVVIRENGNWDNWEMILVEKYPCKDSLEARQREHYWEEQLASQMNMRRAYTNRKEYLQHNIDRIKEYQKEYYQQNKEQKKEQTKEYYQQKKEQFNEKVPCPVCEKVISRGYLSKHAKRKHHTLYNLSPVSQENCPSLLPCPVNPP